MAVHCHLPGICYLSTLVILKLIGRLLRRVILRYTKISSCVASGNKCVNGMRVNVGEYFIVLADIATAMVAVR